jgi:hypothetical protein
MEDGRFGRVLLRTYIGEVLSLTLFETPDLVCRGVYLPHGRRRRARAWAPAEVELVADRDALDEMSRRLGGDGREGDGYFELTTEGMELYGEISPPLESAGRVISAGTLRDVAGEQGEFTFVLEQWGSIETNLLLVILFCQLFSVFSELSLDRAWARCWQQALQQCGEGNIKVFNLNQRMGGFNLVMQSGCQVECFERTAPT